MQTLLTYLLPDIKKQDGHIQKWMWLSCLPEETVALLLLSNHINQAMTKPIGLSGLPVTAWMYQPAVKYYCWNI